MNDVQNRFIAKPNNIIPLKISKYLKTIFELIYFCGTRFGKKAKINIGENKEPIPKNKPANIPLTTVEHFNTKNIKLPSSGPQGDSPISNPKTKM